MSILEHDAGLWGLTFRYPCGAAVYVYAVVALSVGLVGPSE